MTQSSLLSLVFYLLRYWEKLTLLDTYRWIRISFSVEEICVRLSSDIMLITLFVSREKNIQTPSTFFCYLYMSLLSKYMLGQIWIQMLG